jgi:ubiquinone/menaquinone biosynthesis C-methylase UbiE
MGNNTLVERWARLPEDAARAYERTLVPLLFEPGAQALTGLAGLAPAERVLDLACGTGSVARRAAEMVGREGRVVGFDVSTSMLAVAAEAAGNQPQIEWRQGDVGDLPFPNGTFDAVICQQALQFFPDRMAALAEMHRVLAPGGRVVLSMLRSPVHNPGWALFAKILKRHLGEESAALMASPFPEMTRAELRALITEAGFGSVMILIAVAGTRYPGARELVNWEMESWLLAEEFQQLRNMTREAIIANLEEALADYTDDEGIVFPAETWVVVARIAEQ